MKEFVFMKVNFIYRYSMLHLTNSVLGIQNYEV